MTFSMDRVVSITEANQNFSKVAKKAEKFGEVYIFKNNKPKYKLVKLAGADLERGAEDDEKKLYTVILNILKKYRKSIEETLFGGHDL